MIDLVAARVTRKGLDDAAQSSARKAGGGAKKTSGTGSGGEARSHPRRATRLRMGKIADLDDRFLSECAIRDLSAGGAKLIVAASVPLPDIIVLFDELEETIVPATVRWRRGNETGVSFDVPPAQLRHFRSRRLRALAYRYYAAKD
ncbi:PilZ domain-containing protein [Breoghania corrubedonensis]|uniref:PilZ domain-containing protein n=1 Tax=Breoghania corrubedonensis TaxID=665038 RepID=UPI001AECF13E|nr:PilZ domain-containing protein [Breoghania corrubedonensis]